MHIEKQVYNLVKNLLIWQVKKLDLMMKQLEEEAARIVKNHIPNYAFVNEFVKGLRILPVGNFVAFPAEILRTGTNIVSRALDEIFIQLQVKGGRCKTFKSSRLYKINWYGSYNSALPYAAVAAGQMLYDISKDELMQ